MPTQPRSPEFAEIVRREAEEEGPHDGSLEAHAARALKVLALLGYGGVVLAWFPPAVPVGTLYVVLFNVAAAALATIELAVAFGLGKRRPWAVAAVRPLLVFVVALGLYTVVVAWSRGTMRLPLEAVLAAWPFLAPADVKPIARLGRRSIVVLGASGVLSAALAFSSELFDYGGTFDVHEPDLAATVSADCGPAGGGPPDRITLRYEWSWSSTSPLPSGADIAVVGWTGADPEGRPLYTIDDIPDSAEGVYSGLTGYPSTTMADAIARESQASFRWAIELPEHGFAPGHIELHLRRAREAAAGPLSLVVSASYVHLGLWRKDATSVMCTW